MYMYMYVDNSITKINNKPVCPSCFLRMRAALLSRKPNNRPQARENMQTAAPNQTSKVVQTIQSKNYYVYV